MSVLLLSDSPYASAAPRRSSSRPSSAHSTASQRSASAARKKGQANGVAAGVGTGAKSRSNSRPPSASNRAKTLGVAAAPNGTPTAAPSAAATASSSSSSSSSSFVHAAHIYSQVPTFLLSPSSTPSPPHVSRSHLRTRSFTPAHPTPSDSSWTPVRGSIKVRPASAKTNRAATTGGGTGGSGARSPRSRPSLPAQANGAPIPTMVAPAAPAQPPSTISPLWESTESRVHYLHLQSLHAAQLRHWDKLVTLRVEMLALTKLIHGGPPTSPSSPSPPSSSPPPPHPQVVLAHLALAEAYLHATLWSQAIEHAKQLPALMEHQMKYLQGAFEAHMLLGRAYFGLAREGRGAVTTAAAADSHKHGSASSPSDSSAFLSRSCRHFTLAHALTLSSPSNFFAHTTVRDLETQERITCIKGTEAALGLAEAQGAMGNKEQQLDTLTGVWERVDAYLSAKARRQAKEKEQQEAENDTPSSSTVAASPPSSDPETIDTSLLSLELYFYLGHTFFQRGDDIEAQTNLQHVLHIARLHPNQTLGGALDAAWSSESAGQKEEEEGESVGTTQTHPPPDPSAVHWPYLMLVLESSMLLACSYARSEQHAQALSSFHLSKRYLTNLSLYTLPLHHYYDRPHRPALVPPFVEGAFNAPLPPLPRHNVGDTNHAPIELAWQSMRAREWGFHFNLLVCFDFIKVRQVLSRSLLQVERELAMINVQLERFERAARHQERVCDMLQEEEEGEEGGEQQGEEGKVQENHLNGIDQKAGPTTSPLFPSSPLRLPPPTSSPLRGLYQWDVAKSFRRLGDLYLSCGWSHQARGAFHTSMHVIKVLYGMEKNNMHHVAVQHQKHSVYGQQVQQQGMKRRQRERGSMGSLTALFSSHSFLAASLGSSLPTGLGASSDDSLGTGADRGVPATVTKLLSHLKQALKRCQQEENKIMKSKQMADNRNYSSQAGAAEPTTTHSYTASSTSSDLPAHPTAQEAAEDDDDDYADDYDDDFEEAPPELASTTSGSTSSASSNPSTVASAVSSSSTASAYVNNNTASPSSSFSYPLSTVTPLPFSSAVKSPSAKPSSRSNRNSSSDLDWSRLTARSSSRPSSSSLPTGSFPSTARIPPSPHIGRRSDARVDFLSGQSGAIEDVCLMLKEAESDSKQGEQTAQQKSHTKQLEGQEGQTAEEADESIAGSLASHNLLSAPFVGHHRYRSSFGSSSSFGSRSSLDARWYAGLKEVLPSVLDEAKSIAEAH